MTPARRLAATLAVVGVAVSLVLGGLLGWMLLRERRRVDDDLAGRAERSARLAALLLRERVDHGRALARAVAGSHTVQAALADGSAPALLAALAPFRDELGSTLLVVEDGTGRPLGWSTPGALFTLGKARHSAGTDAGLIEVTGEPAALLALPIERDGTALGRARVAVLLGRLFLREASDDLETPLALFAGGALAHHVFTGGPPPAPPAPPEPAPDGVATTWTVRARLGGSAFVVGYAAVPGIAGDVRLAAGVDRGPALGAVRRFAGLLGASAGGAVLLVVAAVGLFLRGADQRERLERQRDEAHRRSAGLSDRLAHLAAVVHDIKAPVAGIQLRCEQLLEDGGVPAPVAPALERVVDTCERLGLFLVNVLTAAQADEGAIAPRPEVVLLPGLLEDVAERLAPLAARQRARLVTRPAPGLAPVTADPALLERALWNLAANALAAVRPGGTVELFAEREAGALRLGVRDDGPGFTAFPPETAFSRGRPTPRHESMRTGTGLGLYIVARVAEAHGGHAVAINHPEGGAEVAIVLPGPA